MSTEARVAGLALTWAALSVLRLAAPSPHASDGWTASVPSALSFAVPERRATLLWWQVGRAWAAGEAIAPDALAATVQRIGAHDPDWRTPWIYGGLMLQATDDPRGLSAAEHLLREGAARWPDDPWFPAALGVQLQDAGRIDEARRWLRAARERS
jgi:hypothetical protein